MRATLIIVEMTWREVWRRKIVWVALILGIAFIALYGIGFNALLKQAIGQNAIPDMALDSGFSFVAMSGLYAVSFLGIMLAVLLSVGALSAEIQSHTVQALATKPIRRYSIVIGKWLGIAMMVTLYVGFLAGGIIVVTHLISDYWLPHAIQGIALIILQAIIMLSLSILGGTRLSTVANGVVAFMLYGFSFLGGWIERIGSVADSQAAMDIGIWSSLLVPCEAMWHRAAFVLQPPMINALNISPFSMPKPPSMVMLIYAIGYCMMILALAVRTMNQRDL